MVRPYAWAVVALGLLLGGLLPLTWVCAQEPAAAGGSIEEQLGRANEGLASPDRYPEAIAGYRAILVDHPEHRETRLWLARVLSWSQDLAGALDEYAELRRQHPGDHEIRVEQGEVLSWSGAYERSLEAFQSIPETSPQHARAVRGVARVHRWSGRDRLALEAYERALALEDDPEARGEWETLSRAYRPDLELETRFFSDSSDFDRREVWLTYSGFQDADTRVSVRLGSIELSHSQDDVAPSVRSADDDDRALDLGARLDRKLEAGPRLTLELGGRRWAAASDSFYGRLHAEHTVEGLGSFGLHLVHEDFTDVASSYEAVSNDVQHTAVAASFYRQLGPKIGTFWRIDLGSVDDGNTRHSLYGSVGYRPWPAHELELTSGVRLAGFSDDSLLYYAPERDLGLEVVVDHRIPVTSELRAEYTAALGFQSTKEGPFSESGTLWRAEGRMLWDRDPWSVGVRFGVSYSQRSSRYKTRRGRLEIERRF